MNNLLEERAGLFLETSGESLGDVSDFANKPEEIQHEQLTTLAKVCLSLAPGLNGVKRNLGEVKFDEPKINKNEKLFENSEIAKTMDAHAKSEGKIVASFNCMNEIENGGWVNKHRFCQPSFRGRGIMKELLAQTEDKIREKGGTSLQFTTTGVQNVCWALAQGFKVIDKGEREEVYDHLLREGWQGGSSQKEFLSMVVGLLKNLD